MTSCLETGKDITFSYGASYSRSTVWNIFAKAALFYLFQNVGEIYVDWINMCQRSSFTALVKSQPFCSSFGLIFLWCYTFPQFTLTKRFLPFGCEVNLNSTTNSLWFKLNLPHWQFKGKETWDGFIISRMTNKYF